MSAHARLSVPFAVAGLVGGWLTAGVFQLGWSSGRDRTLRLLMVVCTATVAGCLGGLLATRARAWSGGRLALLGALAIAGAGIANGMSIGVFTAGVREFAGGIVVGALFGALCSLPFIPALGLILAAARRVGRARAPSVVDSLDRRRVWLATATAIGLATAAARAHEVPAPAPFLLLSSAIAGAAAVAIAALLILDARQLLAARVAVRQLAETRPHDPGAPGSCLAGVRYVDFGIGDEASQAVRRPSVVYRDVDRVVSVIRGNPVLARRSLGRSLWMGAFALMATTSLAMTHHAAGARESYRIARVLRVAREP